MSLLVNLPAELSLSILTEWIQLPDLCALDVAFCTHPKKNQANKNVVSRQDYLQMLQNPHFILSDFFYTPQEHLAIKYLKWLAKRGIKVTKLPFIVTSLPEILTYDHLNFTRVKEISFIRMQAKKGKKGSITSQTDGTNNTTSLAQMTSSIVNSVWSLISLPNGGLNSSIDDKEKNLDDNDLLSLAKELPKSLESISFHLWKQITNNQLSLLLSKSNLQLHTINLSRCTEITDDAIVLLIQQYSHCLQHLNISCCLNITGIFFSAIYSLCQSFHCLNISYCHNISLDLLTMFITRYHHLIQFLAEDLAIITNSILIDLATNHSNLKLINIDYCRNVNIDCLNDVLKIQPYLEYFISKDYCYKYDPSGGNVNMMMNGQTAITSQYANPPIISRELMLKGCYTRHTALNQLLSNFPNTAPIITDSEGREIPDPRWAKIPGLQSINASECRKFSDISIQTVTQRFNQSLISLKISPWKDIQINSFHSLFQQCSYLQIINLSYCETLTDAILQQISMKIPHLKELYLNYCPLITDIGLHGIFQHCLEMRILECENCLKISNNSMKNAFIYSIHLQRLNLVATGITSEGFQSMITLPENMSIEGKGTRMDNAGFYWEGNENMNCFTLLVSDYWRDRIYWKYYQEGNEFQKKILKKVEFIPTQMSHNNHHPH